MSSQKFTAIEREAIWHAHGKKCAYSRALLDISSFHIDHIIPETLVEKPEELKEALTACGRDDAFDVFGWENLVPCAPGANLQKSSHVFDPATAMFFLGMAAVRKPDVLKELDKVKRRAASGRAIVMIQQFLALGRMTPEAAADLINDHISEPQEVFRLLESLDFADVGEIKVVSRSELDELRDRPIKMGQNTHIEGVQLTGPNNEKKLCRTCREYDTALSDGYYAQTNFDIKMSTWFEHQCGLLSALQVAESADKSFVSEPRAGVVDLHLLPYSFFPVLTKHDDDVDTKSYQDMVDAGELTVRRLRSNMLTIERPEQMGQVLVEVIRADFNGDGIEDILLLEYCYAIGGTMGWGNTKLITRFSADEKFSALTGI